MIRRKHPSINPKAKDAKKVKPVKVVPLSKFMGADSRISEDILSASKSKPNRFTPEQVRDMLKKAEPAPGVLPKGHKLAMDDANYINNFASWSGGQFYNVAFSEGYTFMGYAYLAELAQIPEYRIIADVIATEATRRFIKIKRVGASDDEDDDNTEDPDDAELSPGEEEAESEIEAGSVPEEEPSDESEEDVTEDAFPPQEAEEDTDESEQEPDEQLDPEQLLNTDPEQEEDPLKVAQQQLARKKKKEKEMKVRQLEKEFERLKVKDLFQTISEHDSWFGRSHIYIDTGATEDEFELKVSIGDGTGCLSQNKVEKGSIIALRAVEPIWCYPSRYNASNPLKEDWYNPERWFVMAQDIHKTRFLTFTSMPVPDIMKPAFSFGGLSRSQMAKPYIDNWLQTRQSVNDLIQAFSTMVLSTNMQTSLQPGNQQVLNRADLFNNLRNNRNLMMIDKDTEEFNNVSVPLGTLDALQAQAQEHICAVSRIPLVKYTGISPQGLNASSEGEIRVFYDTIHAYQEKFFGPHLWTIFRMLQLNLWGEIDPELTFEFEPLWELDEKTLADKKYQDAQTATLYVDKGILAPEEVRATLVKDPDQPYGDLDPDEVPEPVGPEPGDIKERIDEDGTPGAGAGGTPFGGSKEGEEPSGENPEGGEPVNNQAGPGANAKKSMNLTGGKKMGKEKN